MTDDPVSFAAQALSLALYARGYAPVQLDDGQTVLRGPRGPEPLSPWQALQRELGA
jgi:hypothetical protein